MIAGKFCLAAVAVFMIAMSAMGDGHGEFGQVARGVLLAEARGALQAVGVQVPSSGR